MNVPTWAGLAINGTATGCARATDKVVQIGGTFVATFLVQATINGTDWETLQTFTGTGFCDVEALCPSAQSLRIRQTANTSGAATATLGSRPSGE